MRVFVYGTLLDPGLMARLTGRPAVFQPASAAGWRRARLRGTPYPTLVPARDVVRGAVIHVDAPALRRLQRYEGPRYRLCPVTVRIAGGNEPQRAHTWIARGATTRGWS